MSKKYEIVDETIIVNDVTLYRIRALRDFGNVRAGELGGFVESERNLSHEGYCWIYANACVCGGADVFENAIVSGDAIISGSAWVRWNAHVTGNAIISGGRQRLREYHHHRKHKLVIGLER